MPAVVGFVIEFDRAEEVAMVGHRDGRHLLLLATVINFLMSQAPSSSE